ncbi:BamA/TamA family outer membrane protein [Subsaximicrobium wynnwilliamsii]|uniref:BamA/TamA family outer membrane protein n=1 Tax=Subsaximicrobium wynnwilliamsii TaxID=291179 RepID=UPI001CB9D76F|nr:BamA/TamA family outer membrane protein [Subsaximicrobium wynnwilliamsii]
MGKTEAETKTIDSLGYASRFEDLQSLKLELANFSKKIETIGYIDQKLLSYFKENDSLYLAQFSLKKRFSQVRIYNKELVPRSIFKMIDTKVENDHFTVPIEELELTLQLINAEIANEGSPFLTLTLEQINKNDDFTLSARLTASNTSARTIDNIIVKGYEKFPESYLKHFLKLKTGQDFNLKKIKLKSASLNNLMFANVIRDPEVLFTQDSTLLYMYIEKNKSNTFDGFLGFGTNENTNKIEFDGYLRLNLTNNLNYGESLKLLYKSDEIEQKTFDLSLQMPFLFGSPLGATVKLNIFKRDSTFVTVEQSARINYQFDPKNSVSLGVKAINSTDLLDLNTSIINDYRSNSYFANYQYTQQRQKDPLFPIDALFDFTAGTGSRIFDQNRDAQNHFALETYKIFDFNATNSFFSRLTSEYFTSNTFLENELFRFGGINSIRGFEENSLLANLYAVLNTEYRYRLNSTLYVHSVVDAAYFENQLIDQKGKLFGFGFGFGLLTKAGLFKFNYSSGKTENQSFSLTNSKIHLSLTALF